MRAIETVFQLKLTSLSAWQNERGVLSSITSGQQVRPKKKCENAT